MSISANELTFFKKKILDGFFWMPCPDPFNFTRSPGANWATAMKDRPFPSELSSALCLALKKERGKKEKRCLSCQIWQLSATLMGQNDDRSLHSVSYNLIVINYERNYSSSTWVQIFLFASFIKFCAVHPVQCSTNNNYHSVSTQREFNAVWSSNIIFTSGQNNTLLFQHVKYIYLRVELRTYFKYSRC